MLKMLTRFKPARYALAVLFALCLPGSALAASPVLDRIVEKGVLRVAMSTTQPPYNIRARDKTVIGFDVDLAQALADAMSVQLEIVEIPFGNLLETLADDKVDMVISGLSITPERSRKVSFVGPYNLSGKSMLTTARIKGVVTDGTQFNDPDIQIVALENSTSESFVQRNLEDASLHTVPNYDQGIEMLLTGRVDVMVADIPILKLSMLRYPDAGLGIIEPPLSVEPIGIAIGRQDQPLENLLRNYLAAFEKTGLIAALQKKWFEDNSWIALVP
jgi:polar amino acid transport system substrate-binding protein